MSYGNLANQFPNIGNLTGNNLVQNNGNIAQLNSAAAALNSQLSNIQGQSNNTLSEQQTTADIINAEKARLDSKKATVDDAYANQQRALHMNDNIQKRYNAYSKILFVTVIVFFVIFVLVMLQSYLPFIPGMVFNIVYIGLVSFLIIYCLGIYFDIQRHEKIDFDRIYNKPMTANSMDISWSSIDNSANDMSMNLFCANNSCCSKGTYWNTNLNQCSPGNPPGLGKESFISSNDAYEYNSYAPL
jgi:hypothetical protein